ncbi:MAG: amidohydrolase family protein, partial [Gemmatimonadetes bacterium]|nr:amidohydrolase family protein [Gemmatimonadota bacterium]
MIHRRRRRRDRPPRGGYWRSMRPATSFQGSGRVGPRTLPMEAFQVEFRPYAASWAVLASVLTVACGDAHTTAGILIRGATVVDGSGQPGYVADVAITGDRVVHVGPDGPPARDTVEAAGLMVAPGFVDVHSHTPPALMEAERRLNEGVVRQGVTTVVGGPDGGFSPSHIRQLTEAFESQGIGTNVAFYVGHNAIRNEVMVEDQQRAPTEQELDEMKALVREGMALGALGLSTGLMYEPGMFSETDEVVALAQEVAPFGGIYDSHVRNPVHDLLGSDREVIQVAESADITGKIGHLKAVGLHNEGAIRQVIDLVEEARARGVDIVSDQYPYDGAATASLTDIIVVPPQLETLAETVNDEPQSVSPRFMEALRTALANPRERELLKVASENGVAGGFAWLKATGYGSMRITSSTDFPELVGSYLSEIAETRDLDPFDAVAELILSADDPVNLTLGAIKEHDVRDLLVQPWNMIASDGGDADGSESGEGHPRSAGTFPRLLGHYVRQEGVLSIEEAVRKITSLPASSVGLAGRGLLEVGAFADVV